MTTISGNSSTQIGRIIAWHRKQSGLSRTQLAELASIGKTTLYDIEHGKPTVRFDSLRRVLNVLNISIQLQSPLMVQLEHETDASS